MSSPSIPRRFRESSACRALNIVVAVVGLILAAPVMLVIAVLIKATSRGPVLYRQRRIGINRRGGGGVDGARPRELDVGGRPFTMLKFRTMRHCTARDERQVWAARRDPRITAVGRVLRQFRLDELPQLVNVLCGDMNVVGPRPEQPEIVRTLLSEVIDYAERHRVRPGITGLAQINLSYDQSIEDVRRKVALDIQYVQNRSALTDLQIMVRTPLVMLGRRGAL